MKEQLQKAIAEGKEVTVYLKITQIGNDKRIEGPIVAADEIGICVMKAYGLTMVPWENVEHITLKE